MNFAAADEVVKAVLYEGYVLYPYRPTSIKNQQRWSFGGIYPKAFPSAGAAQMQTQCLVEGDEAAWVEARVRFLQPIERQVFQLAEPAPALSAAAEAGAGAVPSLSLDGRSYHAWEEVVERAIALPTTSVGDLRLAREPHAFAFAASEEREPIVAVDGRVHGFVVRRGAAIEGAVTLQADPAASSHAFRLTARVDNLTPAPFAPGPGDAAAQLRGFMSTHIILGVEGGAFV